jgi:predicted molibdopterin-dependent oxidoreductase YjgC
VAYTDWTSFGDYFFEPYGSPQEMDVPYTVTIASQNGGAVPCRIYPERSLFHSHTPNRFSKALNSIDPASSIVISPALANRFGVHDARSVRISVNGSSLSLACTVEAGLDDSTIRILNSLGKDCAMSLVDYQIDSQTGAAVWKLPEIRMERGV